jgi:hypothetical protein
MEAREDEVSELLRDQWIIDWFHSDDDDPITTPSMSELRPFMQLLAMRSDDV